MIACPYCFSELKISTALAQMIGRFDLVIECPACHQRVLYKKEPKPASTTNVGSTSKR